LLSEQIFKTIREEMSWYQNDINEVFEELKTSELGINDSDAEERLQSYGPNKLAEEEKISRLNILLHQFTSPLIYILLVAAFVMNTSILA
jgi:Ca2+-transporting ATPase